MYALSVSNPILAIEEIYLWQPALCLSRGLPSMGAMTMWLLSKVTASWLRGQEANRGVHNLHQPLVYLDSVPRRLIVG